MKTEIDRIAEWLRALSQSERRAVGLKAGVPFDTLQKVAMKTTRNPRLATFLALQRAMVKAAK
jgi:hypothetical protein